MKQYAGEKYIVSFTTFPARYDYAAVMVSNLLEKQTYRDFHIVMTLFKDDYAQLGGDLKKLVDGGTLEVIMAEENLCPHLKYYYAMRKYHDKPVITLDDDRVYSPNVIAGLVEKHESLSYKSVVAISAPKMKRTYDWTGLVPYGDWCLGSQCLNPNEKSYLAVAEGFAGVLYPEECFDCHGIDLDELKSILYHDDMYLKVLEIRNRIPVTQVNGTIRREFSSSHICGTQEFKIEKRTKLSNEEYRPAMQNLFERDLLAAFALEHPFLKYFEGGWRVFVAVRRLAGRVKRRVRVDVWAEAFARRRKVNGRVMYMKEDRQEKNSILDDLYYQLYGERLPKKGQALERLSALAFKLLQKACNVQYDQQVRATFSDTVYQLDGLINEGDRQVMVEAKDYTIRGDKVGRSDLLKMEAALIDLDIPEGRFVSATDYTNRAKPFAESTKTNPKTNSIDLYHLRPSTLEDERGRIKKIIVNIDVNVLGFESGQYLPIINRQFLETIKDQIPQDGQKQKVILSQFYNANGEVVETFENVTRQLNEQLPEVFEKGYVLEGAWTFEQPVYIDMEPLGRVLIDSIQYKIPAYKAGYTFAIDQKGKPVLLIKSEDGRVNKLFTDQEFKQFQFVAGEIKKMGQG